MKLKLVKVDDLDWYTIERAEHDERTWLERSGHNCMSLNYSGRISDADVEGPASEMRKVAHAIQARVSFVARRCAVRVMGDRVLFRSPRNSSRDGEVTLIEADELAVQIQELLGQ